MSATELGSGVGTVPRNGTRPRADAKCATKRTTSGAAAVLAVNVITGQKRLDNLRPVRESDRPICNYSPASREFERLYDRV